MISDKNTPRYLGAAFLLQAVASLVATFLLTPLIVQGDISASMTNIANEVLQMRASIVGEMIAIMGIVMLGSLLYLTLRDQNESIALVARGLYLVTAAIIAVSRIATFALLRISQEAVIAGYPDYLQTLYYLFYKSGYLPKILSIWGLIAAPLAFIGTLFDHFGVPVPLILFVPNLPFDFGVGFWLIFMGFQSPVTRLEQTGPHSDRVK